MCLDKLKEVEGFLRGRCECCHGKKRSNPNWYCYKCMKRFKALARRWAKAKR
jgi:hypothetical protein